MKRRRPGLLCSDDEAMVVRAPTPSHALQPDRLLKRLSSSVRDASTNACDEPAGWIGGHALKHVGGYDGRPGSALSSRRAVNDAANAVSSAPLLVKPTSNPRAHIAARAVVHAVASIGSR